MFSHAVRITSTPARRRLAHLSSQLANKIYRVQSRSYRGTTYTLNTGASIPALGFGTWQDKDAQEGAVSVALRAGYRHIDTARVYGTELAVGTAIKKSRVPREELFVTTKLWNNHHHPDDVESALDLSLRDLQMDYVDLFLMHWPSAFKRGEELSPKDAQGKIITAPEISYVDTWLAMEALLKTGKTRAIGISNFSRAELDTLLAKASTVPAVHQLEQHPWLAQHDFSAYHAQHGIHLTQYSPFGNQNPTYHKSSSPAPPASLITDPTLVEIGKKYGRTGAQVVLAWGIAHGRSVIPKSKTAERIRENLEGDFELSVEDVKRVDTMDRKLRFNDASERFGWNFYQDLDGKK